MDFYRLTTIDTRKEIYLNPKFIICYFYNDDNDVDIIFNGGDYATVSAADFNHMMNLEGVNVCWQLLPTVFQSTIKTKLSYYQNR